MSSNEKEDDSNSSEDKDEPTEPLEQEEEEQEEDDEVARENNEETKEEEEEVATLDANGNPPSQGGMRFRGTVVELEVGLDKLERETEWLLDQVEAKRKAIRELQEGLDKTELKNKRQAVQFPIGSKVLVLWKGAWWKGMIDHYASGGEYKVSYTGWKGWEETVDGGRLKPDKGESAIASGPARGMVCRDNKASRKRRVAENREDKASNWPRKDKNRPNNKQSDAQEGVMKRRERQRRDKKREDTGKLTPAVSPQESEPQEEEEEEEFVDVQTIPNRNSKAATLATTSPSRPGTSAVAPNPANIDLLDQEHGTTSTIPNPTTTITYLDGSVDRGSSAKKESTGKGRSRKANKKNPYRKHPRPKPACNKTVTSTGELSLSHKSKQQPKESYQVANRNTDIETSKAHGSAMADDCSQNILGEGGTTAIEGEGEKLTATGTNDNKSWRLPRAISEIADANSPGMRDRTSAHLQRWACSKCHCLNGPLLSFCGECDMRRKRGRQKKSNGTYTSIKQVQWGTARSSQDQLEEPELHRRASKGHHKEDIKKLKRLGKMILEEVNSSYNRPDDCELKAFKGKPVEVKNNSGYFKGELDANFVLEHFSNQCPPGLVIKRKAPEKGVAFANRKRFTCDTHWDDLFGLLLVLSGEKIIYLAPPSVIKSLTEDDTRSNYYFENPFKKEMKGWLKIVAGPGDCVVIPPEWLHCIKSEPGTVGVSLKFETLQGTSSAQNVAHLVGPVPKKRKVADGGAEKLAALERQNGSETDSVAQHALRGQARAAEAGSPNHDFARKKHHPLVAKDTFHSAGQSSHPHSNKYTRQMELAKHQMELEALQKKHQKDLEALKKQLQEEHKLEMDALREEQDAEIKDLHKEHAKALKEAAALQKDLVTVRRN